MGQKKLDRPHILAVPLTAILLLGCVCLLIGTAWARYRYRQITDVAFAPKTAAQVYMFGEKNANGFAPMADTLTETENGQVLDFVVTNGESKTQFSHEDQYACVRLYVSLSLGNGENLAATLTVDSKQYTAVARQLDGDSAVCQTFGEGWIYCFMDENGKELRWFLEGEKLSALDMSLLVDADTGLDSSLLRLMVTG